ncbi:hypothetical protein SDC9_85297 [bioreactor metagenome]|uniref:Uncharacterized protein n=1 Tax=bioreactor metagenome TaxID=1076179 RepID=A0A644ZD91_9ZZZZ
MGYRYSKGDVSHPFPPDLFLGNLYTAPVADYPPVTDSFVFAAMAFVILVGTEYPFTKKSVPFGFIGPVVYSFGLEDFT